MAKLNVLKLFVFVGGVNSIVSAQIPKIDDKKIHEILGLNGSVAVKSDNPGDRIVYDEFEDFHPPFIANISARGLYKLSAYSLVNTDSHLNYRILDASNNHFAELDPSPFGVSSTFELVNFSNNSIQSIDPMAFKALKQMKVLNLSRNKIDAVTFGGFPYDSLLKLDLSSNKLTTLNQNTFENFTNLKHLNLSGNSIRNLERATFLHQKNLITLDLSKNDLIIFDFNALASARVDLNFLDLSKNRLVELKNFRSENMAQLEVLNINDNRFNCSYLQHFLDSIRWGIDLRVHENWHTIDEDNSIHGIHCTAIIAVANSSGFAKFLTIELLLIFLCFCSISVLLIILFLGRKQLFTCGNDSNEMKEFSEPTEYTLDENSPNPITPSE